MVDVLVEKKADHIALSLHSLAVPIDSVTLDARNARIHPGPNLEVIKRWEDYTGEKAVKL